ncbi:MAG: YihA family ribosome biogenesis GTP-binding protein [Clostridiales bacterium]|nr:YihA family ribosome biogenesis GTP-binding protein [Clostridiales bacterium]
MKLNLNKTELKISAGLPSQFPAEKMPQVAFAGRSNVGKSSLINSLLSRKSFARVSSSPGKTITVNFYSVDSALYLVDLPGYGYAKRSPEEKRRWSALTDGYFTNNPNIDLLKLTVCLIDSRIGPTKDDLAMLEFLIASELPHIIVATKFDKLNAAGRRKISEMLEKEELCSAADAVIMYSSVNGSGKEDLWREIMAHCGF